MLLYNLLILCLTLNCYAQVDNSHRRVRRLPMHHALQFKHRLIQHHYRRNDKVCYDTVGCFDMPHKRSPLTKPPESPEIIGTKFFLFQRNLKFSHPQVLYYEDQGLSLNQSKFNPEQPTKIIIHGYLSRWNGEGALEAAHAYLKICDCNVILVDWEKGARGPQYANAAANTEVVGRQLGILLLHMLNLGANPKNIHLIGFSLGAHVAGCASELLKIRDYLIGRITGLDAASPLFRHNHFREKSKKLDREDAVLVDAVHTDASPFFTDGFGLLEPIGHVDFFPNGGFEQPGCVDGTASVVFSHFEGVLNRDTVCSHIRAWELFLESLRMKASQKGDCEFTAFKCKGGLGSFQKGQCFPQMKPLGDPLALDRSYRTDIGKLGEDVRGEGVMYLVTRNVKPYCGTQLQASIRLSENPQFVVGMVNMRLHHGNDTADFKILCEATELTSAGRHMRGLTSTHFSGIGKNVNEMSANLIYISLANEEEKNVTQTANLYIDRLSVEDMYGKSWNYCGKDSLLRHLEPITINLSKQKC